MAGPMCQYKGSITATVDNQRSIFQASTKLCSTVPGMGGWSVSFICTGVQSYPIYHAADGDEQNIIIPNWTKYYFSKTV